MASGKTNAVGRVAGAAMRAASIAYRLGYRRAGTAMPADSDDHAVAVFEDLQRSAHAASGWSGLLKCWAREAASLASVRGTVTDHDAYPRPRLFSGLTHDVRDAWRSARRAPGAPLVIVVTLALGIGVNTAVFSLVDALLFKQLPYPGVERLVRVAEWPRSGGNFTVAPLAFLAWRARTRAFDGLEAMTSASFVHLGTDGPEEEPAARVTPGYLKLFGATPLLGRTFVDADATPGGDCRVLVSHRFWARRLGADASLVGGTVPFAGRSCTLVGVLEPDTVFDRTTVEIYTPLAFDSGLAASNGRSLTVVGRLAPGTSLAQAESEMVGLAASVNATRGRAGEGWTAALTPWRDVVVRSGSRGLAWTLFGAVSLVLLVACVNVAGLSLARSLLRRREWAVRLALGAGRWRAFRALVVDGLLLALAGEAVGVVVGSASLRGLRALLPPGTVPPESVAAMDSRALIFASVVSVIAALACATAPAWRGARANLADALRDGRGTAGSRQATRVNAGLLVAEIALAMVLVSSASTLAVSFARLVRVDPGFQPAGVLSMHVALPTARYQEGRDQTTYFVRALDAMRAVPGVTHAAAVTSLPLGGWLYGIAFSILEQPDPGARRPSAHIQVTSDDYFATLGIPLVAGRDFTARDDAKAPPVAVVNETFARRFIGDANPIGRHIVMDQPAGDRTGLVPWEIVGVIRSVKTGGLSEAAMAVPEIYVPLRQTPIDALYLAVRTAAADPTPLAPRLRAALNGVDPEVPMSGVLTMSERLGVSVRVERFRTGLIAAFAMLAGVLACVGVYGVRARAVTSRRREMGLRLALGARRADITGTVVGEGLKLVGIGMSIGVVGSVLVGRLFKQWLFATTVADPTALAISALALGGAALAACWIPARRAARVDPLVALRDD